MTVPTIKVEMAFGADVFSASPTWTDISSYVQSARVRRGRSDDFSEFPAGTATIVVDNNSRTFDPFNSSSPYQPNLVPRVPVRISGRISGVDYPIFRGYVNGWPVVWSDAGRYSTITIQCFDIMGLISTANFKSDFADIYTRSLSPFHYWKCSDPSGSSTVYDFGSQAKSLASSANKLTSQFPLAIGLSSQSANFSNNSPYSVSTGSTPSSGNITIAFWANFQNNIDALDCITLNGSGGASITFRANHTYSTYKGARVLVNNGATTTGYITTTSISPTGVVPHHYVITYTKSSGAVAMYIDGVSQGMVVSDGGAPVSGANFIPISSITVQNATFQEIAVFGSVLNATQISNIYQYGVGFKTDDTADRIEYIRSISDVPSSFTSFYNTTQSDGYIAGIPESDSPVLAAMQITQRTEGGHLFVTKNGTLKGTYRQYPATDAKSLTSQADFRDAVGYLNYVEEFEYWYDGDNIRNDVVVSYGGGNPVSASDGASIAKYGRHTQSITTQSSEYVYALDLANYWLSYYKQVVPSLTPIEVGLTANTNSEWVQLLSLELLERISFYNTPNTGSAISTFLLINSIELDMKPTVWSMKIGGSSRFTYLPPTATGASASFNQNSATLSASVNANGNTTSVVFEYGTDPTFTTVTTVSATPSTVTGTTLTSVTASLTGLANGTQYYFRVRATNSVGVAFSSGSFTTYSLKTVVWSSSGTWTMPSLGGGITPTTALNAVAVGAGGDAIVEGGGGGGAATYLASMALSSSMTATVPAVGGGSASLTTLGSANGGQNGTAIPLAASDGGASGNGNAGGIGYFAFMTGEFAGGGGGGNGGVGGNYRTIGGSPQYGGQGGVGSTHTLGFTFGSGGGGNGGLGNGSNGNGSPSTYGRGANGFYHSGDAGSGGYVSFQYYGPTGSRSGTGWSET